MSPGLPVAYELIGRQIHSGDHFQIILQHKLEWDLGNTSYHYMPGTLKLLSETDHLETPELRVGLLYFQRR